ncbi:glycosyltransferase family 4 protein [Sporosarcina trichiuri]|uniref:glycosyltransferase family 4 protein n=1 Tax=Sporosarcina trichiuri TaxID=3056445 RepID=UPI0025B36D68|nr:glycosyltransferase [Sporosarcina sp. 0.2-SM1T-5]WJY26417.1 glycosyltransferase [Sporosarcina sp. 0.2-SM1T-5]
MKKVGICGFFGEKNKQFDGQSVKTKQLQEELNKVFGSETVMAVNTFGWKSNPLKLFLNCISLMKNCESIIILPAQNGIKVFIPLFLFLNKVFNRKLHYVVIGAWLPELLSENLYLKNKVSKFNGIYVETNNMIKSLNEMGLKNVNYFPNFKQLEVLEEKDLGYEIQEPYSLCTFSRVVKEKGIEDAIKVVKNINDSIGRVVYTLDIYGKVDESYKDRFEELEKEFPDYILYKGVINFNESVNVLRGYFTLLFPTHYKTEGIPGTIIDAYAAGLPVIASNWNSASEIVIHDTTGMIYEFMESSELEKILFQAANNPIQLNNMRGNCLRMANKYLPKTVIGEFVKNL